MLVPVYWHHYGPSNFLWVCDIALFAVLAALWLENRLPSGIMAIGVLPFELARNVDSVAEPRLLGMARYLFDAELPLHLRGLSLYHTVLPVLTML